MTMLDTTQEYGANAQFIAGSLSWVTITLKNKANGSKPTHEFWATDITAADGAAAPDLIAGREYEVKTVVTGAGAPNAATWKSIGLKKVDNMGADALPVAGDRFVAAKEGVLPGGVIPLSDAFVNDANAGTVLTYPGGLQAGIAKATQSVQARASIVYIGTADSSTNGGPGSGKIRMMLENAADENYSRENNGDIPEGDEGWPTGAHVELQRALRELEGEEASDDSTWEVAQFRF